MSERFTVLVVDDEEDIRDLLGDYLGESGYEILSAASGREMRCWPSRCRTSCCSMSRYRVKTA